MMEDGSSAFLLSYGQSRRYTCSRKGLHLLSPSPSPSHRTCYPGAFRVVIVRESSRTKWCNNIFVQLFAVKFR